MRAWVPACLYRSKIRRCQPEAQMGYGKGKTEGGHKRGHSAMALWVTPSGGQDRGPQAAAARRAPAGKESREGSRWRRENQRMQRLRLKGCAPHEPEPGDWCTLW